MNMYNAYRIEEEILKRKEEVQYLLDSKREQVRRRK